MSDYSNVHQCFYCEILFNNRCVFGSIEKVSIDPENYFNYRWGAVCPKCAAEQHTAFSAGKDRKRQIVDFCSSGGEGLCSNCDSFPACITLTITI